MDRLVVRSRSHNSHLFIIPLSGDEVFRKSPRSSRTSESISLQHSGQHEAGGGLVHNGQASQRVVATRGEMQNTEVRGHYDERNVAQ